MEMKNTLKLQECLLAKLLGFRKKKIYILYDIFTDYKLITIHYISISQIKKLSRMRVVCHKKLSTVQTLL